MNRRKITHFFKQFPEEGAWMPLPFVTQDERGLYYEGYDNRPFNDTDELENYVGHNGHIEKLPEPIEVDANLDNQDGLWLTPDGEIYFSTKDDPVRDSEHKLVHKVNIDDILLS